jgi:hypothetical protein
MPGGALRIGDLTTLGLRGSLVGVTSTLPMSAPVCACWRKNGVRYLIGTTTSGAAAEINSLPANIALAASPPMRGRLA